MNAIDNELSPLHIPGLEDELIWHEAQDKAISKQPNANTGHNWWRRAQHQEHAVVIRAALARGEKHDN